MHDSFPDQHILMLNAGMNPEALALYAERYWEQDIWAVRGIPQTERTGGEWFGPSEQLCSWGELMRTEFYNDFLAAKHDIGHAMFSVVSRERTRLTNLSVYRPPRREAFGAKEVEVLKLLTPHLRRAFRLHFEFCSLKDRKHSVDMLLDSLAQGVILLGSRGAVIHMNRSALQLCEVGDGLVAAGSGLAAESPIESAKLQALIGRAVSTSLGNGLSAGGALLISRKSGMPLNVVVSPVRSLRTDFRETVRAVVYVTDPSLRIRPCNELLEAIYGLTPAECRIALLVGDGFSAATIREMAGITANTLRTHLASIYRKTNTARQTQLVKLISLIGMLGSRTSS